jgi:orotidine-5'-phosphate decarboxylase
MALGMTGSVAVWAEDQMYPAEPNPSNALYRRWLVVALDKPTVEEAQRLIQKLGDSVEVYKIGLELAVNGGLKLASDLQAQNKRVFLDLKMLDIGNTIQKAVANVARNQFDFLTVHAIDRKTLDAAVKGREADTRVKADRLKLLGVTVQTNLREVDLVEQGITERGLDLAVRRAKMAFEAGFDGVIASGHEAKAIRGETNREFIIKIPGIRLPGSPLDDQARTMTPEEAIIAAGPGKTYLVVGRPIANSANPARTADEIVQEIGRAQSLLAGG